jgi:hypothetical protein
MWFQYVVIVWLVVTLFAGLRSSGRNYEGAYYAYALDLGFIFSFAYCLYLGGFWKGLIG